MKYKLRIAFAAVVLLVISSMVAGAQQSVKPMAVEPGVSLALAKYRHSVISDIQYMLNFDIPSQKNDAIKAVEAVSFNLKTNSQALQIDFKQSADHVNRLNVNGKDIPVTLNNEHLVVPVKYLHPGINVVLLGFVAGDASLNRNNDYLYALFVPDRARTVFPCFDQPDLKAHFSLTLKVPADWKVLANAPLKDSTIMGDRISYQFSKSARLPTYLFSFTAGKYSYAKKMIGDRSAEFLYRETDPTKIKWSVDSVFKAHQDAIGFLESWTGIPFPFQKVGFVGIPDFQFGGMEHPGEVQYKASSLFLDEGATKEMLIARSNLISHETAHMWFGDMVTMEWFNDVWMKEVFANFMADKVTEKLLGTETFNLKFLQDHYPAAYGVDRTRGANPIRQQLDNLQDAGSLYGNIIYHKAPIMMRQLELLMGKDNFQAGVREYLKKYAYGNATWNDLIAILSKHSKTNLYNWNKVWVNLPGRPVFDHHITYLNGKISSFEISQTPETGTPRIWPQAFSVLLVYANHTRELPVNMNQQKIALMQAVGLPKPLYVLYNSDGMGYGLFPADKEATVQSFNLESPLKRASAYINAYENMLAGRYYKPAELLTLFTNRLAAEKNEMDLRLLTGYIGGIYWEFITTADRSVFISTLEKATWEGMEQQTAANNKKILFKAYQEVYLSDEAKSRIYQIWKEQKAPAGVRLSEDDYTSLALSIALKTDTVTSVLKQQEARIGNADRKARLEFLMPALSLDVKQRDGFFDSLRDRNNRAKEAYVTTALSYLNHPLRQATSEKYLPQSLELLEEIQRTGDVFFPQSWLAAVFGSYQDKEAYKVVSDFLKAHPNYNLKLKDKILQATDNLYRAQKLVAK